MRLILPLQAVISFLSFFNKITEENFPELRKDIPYRYKKHTGPHLDKTRKETLQKHTIVKTLNIQNKKNVLIVTREKKITSHKKENPSEK